MRKSDLRALRTLNATDTIIRMAENDKPYKVKKHIEWKNEDHEYGYDAKYLWYGRLEQLKGRIVKIALFHIMDLQQGKHSAGIEVFLDIVDRSYITRYWEKGVEKWSEAMLFNIVSAQQFYAGIRKYIHTEKTLWMSLDNRKLLKSLLKDEKGKEMEEEGVEIIYKWQQDIKDDERLEKERRECQMWDDDMDLVPRLPKEFKPWAANNSGSHFIFYNAGEKVGHCTKCDKYVEIKGQKHKREGVCPSCDEKITYMARGKMSQQVRTENEQYAQMIQPIEGGYVVRNFNMKRLYGKGTIGDVPTICMNEIERLIVQGTQKRSYRYQYYKFKKVRWCKADFKINSNNVYPVLPDVLREHGEQIIIEKHKNIHLENYISARETYAAVETLTKLGLADIVADLIPQITASYYSWTPNRKARKCVEMGILKCDMGQTEAAKALYIDKFRLKRLRSFEKPNTWHLVWLQEEKRADTVYDDEMIDTFAKADIIPSSLGFIKENGMSYRKIMNYLAKQTTVIPDGMEKTDVMASTLQTWRDYLDMAKKNKLQMNVESVYAPKNLKQAHDMMIIIGKADEAKKKAKEVRGKYKNIVSNIKKLTKYEYSDGKYCVVAPKNVEDIVTEGLVLGHCIHRCEFYFDRIDQNETYILFLRKTDSPEVPWYTMEVEPGGNIRQKRTYGDNQNPDFNAAVPFLKKRQKEVKKRMTEEEKKLAKAADEARKAEYKVLRENGNKIWHGKLSGKLLVDVLEKDFMLAEG